MDMKAWTKLLAALAVAVMTSAAVPAMAADDKPATPAKADKASKKALKGSVVKVDGTKLVISAGKKSDPKEVTVETDDNTVITVDGAAAKLADLKPGQKVTISPDSGTATKIEATAPKAKKAK
jgi:hypothetical protein